MIMTMHVSVLIGAVCAHRGYEDQRDVTWYMQSPCCLHDAAPCASASGCGLGATPPKRKPSRGFLCGE